MTELGIEFTRLFFIFLSVFGISAFIGAGLEKIAQIFGFGDRKKLSFVLDNLYKELEGGQAIYVKEYFNNET